jgi:hypothetical protein
MEPDLRSRISLRSLRATKRRNRVMEDRKPGPTSESRAARDAATHAIFTAAVFTTAIFTTMSGD